VERRRVRPCSLALADGTVWGSSSERPYRAPFGALLVVLGFLAKYPPRVLAKISATGMVEAALAPLHIKGSSPCEYPHTQCNVQMDLNAKAHLSTARLVPQHYDIPGEPWQLWVNGQKVKAAIFPTIYSHVHNRDGELYWAEKRQQELTTISNIDWTLIGKAMRSIPRSRRVFISKHVSGMCGVGKFMKRWKEWEDDRCPRCGEPEDAPHVWRCKGEGTADIWTKSLEGLASLLRKLDTDPTLLHIILVYLRGWWAGVGPQYVPPLVFQTLVEDQGRVGWSRFFEGWLVHQWTICQQRYYQIFKSKRTGRWWTIAVIKKQCDIAWDMWEHRNSVLHEKENLVTRSMVVQLDAKVSRIYNDLYSRALRNYDRYLVHLSLSSLLRKDTNYKVTWISVTEPALREGRHEAWVQQTRHDCMIQGMRRCMMSWLRK
jgi:hypothetical protein